MVMFVGVNAFNCLVFAEVVFN